jgi:hypothetical protein
MDEVWQDSWYCRDAIEFTVDDEELSFEGVPRGLLEVMRDEVVNPSRRDMYESWAAGG